METQPTQAPTMKTRTEYVTREPGNDKAIVLINIVSEKTNEDLCHAIIHEREHIVRVMGMYTQKGKRRIGLGNKMMTEIVKNLDRIKKAAYLEVDSYEVETDEDTGMDDDQLRYWYGRFGFDDVPGHPFAMVRYPK